MAVNGKESIAERVGEWFTQSPEDRSYEEAGGDASVPQEMRKGDPRREAREFAHANGQPDPYPEDGPLDATPENPEERKL